jgi:hypothetical protein
MVEGLLEQTHMRNKILSSGDTVEARCTRCRAVLNHTIVALVDGRIARVVCNTCRGEHNYHPPAAPKTSAATSARTAGAGKVSKPRAAKKDPEAADRQEWTELCAGVAAEQGLAYSMTGKFRMNAFVRQPVFGLGIVRRVDAGKVEILFQDGKKLLKTG